VLADLLASRRTHAAPIPLLIVPVVTAAFGYALFRRLSFDLVDEVWDEGDALLVRDAGIEEHVMLKNIINVGFSTMTNPERVDRARRESR
jgi:hypothetical protein